MIPRQLHIQKPAMVLMLASLLAVASLVALPPQAARAALPARWNVEVGAVGWTSTYIDWLQVGDVTEGVPLMIEANGTWGEGGSQLGPAGNPDPWPDNFFNLTDLGTCNYCAKTKVGHFEALVGYIGGSPPRPGSYTSKNIRSDAEKVFYVGDRYDGKAPRTGRLWLAMNADAYSGYTVDNSGKVTAVITYGPS